MSNMTKDLLWKKLSEPTDKGCKNCLNRNARQPSRIGHRPQICIECPKFDASLRGLSYTKWKWDKDV